MNSDSGNPRYPDAARAAYYKEQYERQRAELHALRASFGFKLLRALVPALLSAETPAQMHQARARTLAKVVMGLRRLTAAFRGDQSPPSNLRIAAIPARIDSARPNILAIILETDGGTTAAHADLVRALAGRFNVLTLFAQRQKLRLCAPGAGPGEFALIREWELARSWSSLESRRADYRQIYENVLREHQIGLVHVRHLVTHTLDIFDLCHEQSIPVIVSIHDFYLTCPTINLIDDQGRFCAGQCTPSFGACPVNPLWFGDVGVLKDGGLEKWRRELGPVLARAKRFITTSRYAKDLVRNVYPQISDSDFDVIEHGRDLAQHDFARAPKSGEPARLLFMGNTSAIKGSREIRALYELDRARGSRLEFHFAGSTADELRDVGVHHGPYRRDGIESVFRAVRPAFAGVFSITAETYCHALTEGWAMGVPAIVNNIGTLAERLEAHGGGWVVDVADTEATYRKLLEILEHPAIYAVEQAKARIAGLPDVARMGERYAEIFDQLLAPTARVRG